MRLYIFAIGGTGSRVLKSLVMQFAAGIRPKLEGAEAESFSVVPIILDPHAGNKAVQDANGYLVDYQRIRQSIYGQNNTTSGFYSVKIESLKDITDTAKSSAKLPPFIYQMPEINEKKFREFIGGHGANMLDDTQYFTNMLISEEEQETEMSKGFYGQPNIGTIALSAFKDSDTFKAFSSAFQSGDRIIFIGSIFGGTGASGMPLLASSLRNESDAENKSISQAPFGAIVVMPYFALDFKADENSKIKQKDFELKTKSALTYYEANLNCYINALYYLADADKSAPIENDPGKGGQLGNRAHIVEFLAGLAIMDFAARPYNDGATSDNEENHRREAKDTTPLQFSLINRSDNRSQAIVNFTDFDRITKEMIFPAMVKYHLLWLYLANGHFQSALNSNNSYIKRGNISQSLITPEISNFIVYYEDWLKEIGGYDKGTSVGSYFRPYIWIEANETDFTNVVNDIQLKKRNFGKRTVKVSDINDSLNHQIDKALTQTTSETMQGKFFTTANLGLEKLFNENYELK